MGLARNVALWDKIITDTQFYSENLKVRDHLRHLDADKIISKRVLKEQNVRSGSGYGPVKCPCAHDDELGIR
jgi:hypothetical protein